MSKVKTDTRKIIRFGSGDGQAVTIPKAWTDMHKTKAKDDVTVVFNNYLLLIPPDAPPAERIKIEELLVEFERTREKERSARKEKEEEE